MGAVDARSASKPLWETRSVFQAGVGAHSPGGGFEGASMPASGAAASTGRFEAVPARRLGEGVRGEGRGSWRRMGGRTPLDADPGPQCVETRPLAASRSPDLDLGRHAGRPLFRSRWRASHRGLIALGAREPLRGELCGQPQRAAGAAWVFTGGLRRWLARA